MTLVWRLQRMTVAIFSVASALIVAIISAAAVGRARLIRPLTQTDQLLSTILAGRYG